MTFSRARQRILATRLLDGVDLARTEFRWGYEEVEHKAVLLTVHAARGPGLYTYAVRIPGWIRSSSWASRSHRLSTYHRQAGARALHGGEGSWASYSGAAGCCGVVRAVAADHRPIPRAVPRQPALPRGTRDRCRSAVEGRRALAYLGYKLQRQQTARHGKGGRGRGGGRPSGEVDAQHQRTGRGGEPPDRSYLPAQATRASPNKRPHRHASEDASEAAEAAPPPHARWVRITAPPAGSGGARRQVPRAATCRGFASGVHDLRIRPARAARTARQSDGQTWRR